MMRMGTEICINRTLQETRVARIENGSLVELSVERGKERSIVGNIYVGRVTRVLPGMQAAFVEIGLSRTAFLYVSHILDPSRAEELNAKEEENFEDESSASETADSTEDMDSMKARPELQQKNISELIKEGEKVLVQVIKEPIGTKGARLTGYVSIPGRYLVYIPESKHIGISRRIENEEERGRLKSIIEKNRPKQGGVIVRTVAIGATEKNLKDDLEYLVKLWGSIKKAGEKQSQPGIVHTDLDLSLKIIRDRVTEDVDRIVIDDLASFKQMTKFIQNFLPRFKKRIELFSDKTPLFSHYGIETEIQRAMARKIWLKSGGYIVIDELEAFTAIDVNTGRFVGRRNLEDTIYQTNMEAVKEIAYQVRLRNLGGIIVLDFIDMDRPQHRDSVYQSLLEELKKDPVRTNVLPVSDLGLIEMTRKRTQESLSQKLTDSCDYCDGTGYVKSRETVVFEILRTCEKEGPQVPSNGVLAVYCHPLIAEFLTDENKVDMADFEKKINCRLSIKVDPNIHLEEFEVFSRET
jgi:ribonuclease G